MTATVRDTTFALLRELGITTIFGNPGSTEETFLKDLPDDFTYVLALQEASVMGIADGYAQAGRRPALVNLHTAAGVGNAMANLMTASQNRTPLLVTAGQQTREMLLLEPWLTNIDPETLTRPWTKWAYQPARAQDVPGALMRGYATAVQPPSGPVFLSLPLDDWEAPAAGPAVVRAVATRVGPDPVRIRQFADALSAASNPVLILGAQLARSDAWNQAVRFAERAQLPVWAAPACERTPFPEDHELYLGALPFAIGPLSQRLKGHDLALVVGAPVFRYYPYIAGDYLPSGLRLLHITDDAAESARAPVGESLISDAGLALEALVDSYGRAPRTTATLTPAPCPTVTPSPREDGPVHRLEPRDVFESLNAVRLPGTILVEESPSNLTDLHSAWSVTRADEFYTSASGSLGWGVPAAVGIALAERGSPSPRPVLAVIGDGSFQYSVQAIWTAAQLRLPILFVVLRNEEYAILKAFADVENTPGVPGLNLPDLDIAAIATGYGCRGLRVETLEALERTALTTWTGDTPTVVEVPVSSSIPSLL